MRHGLPSSVSRVSLRPAWQLYALAAACSLITSCGISLLIPRYVPWVHDEFSYLLAGQTFARFQLTNPTPDLWQFFESHHELMEPSRMSKYPPGQGLVLALGYWLGAPILGVWLSSALFAVSVTWAVRGLFAPRWAVLAGALAITQFGITHYWVHTFWGGSLAAIGGALVFGAAVRLVKAARTGDAILLGLGVVLLMFTRPFEGLLACLVPAGLLLWPHRRSHPERRSAMIFVPGLLVIAAGFLFLGYYNFRVTGSPWRLPYLEYEQRYAGTPYFIWQQPQPPPHFNTPALADYYRDYMVPLSHFYGAPLIVWVERLGLTLRNFLGPFLAALAILGLLIRPRGWSLVIAGSLFACALAMILSYWFSSHYQAGAAVLYLLLAVAGCRALFLQLPRRLRSFGAILLLVAVVQGAVLIQDQSIERDLRVYTSPNLRQNIIDRLTATGTHHLIFVHVEKPYPLHFSWVFNDVDMAASPVIWAWDRGPAENRQLIARYPERTSWRLLVSDRETGLTPIAR